MKDSHVKKANRSSRANKRAIVPRYVPLVADRSDLILDFGCGKNPIHTDSLRRKGFKVIPYDFGANAASSEPKALYRKYDVIFASNVLNVQGNLVMMFETLHLIDALLKRGGLLLANYPNSPRYSGLSSEYVLDKEGLNKNPRTAKENRHDPNI